MPAKKKGAKKGVKSSVKKTVGKSAKKAALRQNSRSSTPKTGGTKEPPSKKLPRQVQSMTKAEVARPMPPLTQTPELHADTSAKVECQHCMGAGKCTAGEPYDKGHHQVFGAKLILTSCFDCLEAAGEHRNSKKLVFCRLCEGSGMVKG
jgi:hypothetical protein